MTSTKPKRRPKRQASSNTPAATQVADEGDDGALVGVQGIRLDQLSGWDPKRGGLVHQDPGKNALDLVRKAAKQHHSA